jgi:hypothetical protein
MIPEVHNQQDLQQIDLSSVMGNNEIDTKQIVQNIKESIGKIIQSLEDGFQPKDLIVILPQAMIIALQVKGVTSLKEEEKKSVLTDAVNQALLEGGKQLQRRNPLLYKELEELISLLVDGKAASEAVDIVFGLGCCSKCAIL